MKLTYRGVGYDYNPPMLEVTESDVACWYRGNPCKYTYVRHVPIPQPAEQLMYRGVAYQTTRQGHIEQLSRQPVAANSTRRSASRSPLSSLRNQLVGISPAAQARRELLQEASLTHKQNIARALEHRMAVAKAQGNDQLLQQLESEMSQVV